MFVVVAAWAAVLLVVAYLSVRHDEPTVPEQRDVAAAAPVVDRAIGQLVAAAGDDVVVELSPPRLTSGCRLTPLRDGAALDRSVTVRTAVGAEPTVLDRVAQWLPGSYHAGTRRGRDGATVSLRADAGEFVGIRGALAGPGVLTLTAATGCRPASPNFDPTVRLLYGLQIDEEPPRILAALGISPSGPVVRFGAPCPGGGAVHTARGSGRASGKEAPLETAVRPAAGGAVVADTPDLYAYRDGRRSVVVERVDREILVAVSEGCGQ
ncbi:MAG TPA: hypothetical protein VF462_07440 [Micromonosporaceae bacterium]